MQNGSPLGLNQATPHKRRPKRRRHSGKGKEKDMTLEMVNTVFFFIPYVQGMRLVKAKAIYYWQ